MAKNPKKAPRSVVANKAAPSVYGKPKNQADGSTGERFPDTPKGWAQRWKMELAGARDVVKKWHRQGEKIVDRYLDEREKKSEGDTRWNLFTANTENLEALLFGKTPKVDVQRRYNDANDDVARVGATMLDRALNSDIERSSDRYKFSLENALKDRDLPGMGNVRCIYRCTMSEPEEIPPMLDEATGAVLAEGYTEPAAKLDEHVEVVYVPWKDQLWSPARFFEEIRWWAFRGAITREQAIKHFGDVGRRLPLNEKKGKDASQAQRDSASPWDRVEVWEIWDKEHLCVWWYVDGFDEVLAPVGVEANENGSVPDPLELEDFWPFERPMVAHLTTTKYLPTPDFVIAQDLYNQIDQLATRSTMLQRAIRVTGLYDKNSVEAKRLLTESAENQLFPVENWAMFAEKGGIKGVVDFFPLEMIVAALEKVNAQMDRTIAAVYQITGFSDIMRGQASEAATATEQAIKAKFGSIRVQRRQDEFADFASGVQRIKAEIICKHFDPQTIIERSNIEQTDDAKYAQAAVKLLQSNFAAYRVVVKSESVSLTDYAANKQEMTEVLGAIATTVSNFMPLVQAQPRMLPHVLRILQAFVARLRGGDIIESILDEAIAEAREQLEQAAQQAALQAQQGPPPDPKLQATLAAAHAKTQGELAKTQATAAARHAEINHETRAAIAERAVDHHFNVAEDEAQDRREALKLVGQVTSPTETAR